MADPTIPTPPRRKYSVQIPSADEQELYRALALYVRMPLQTLVLAALRHSLPRFMADPSAIKPYLDRPRKLVAEIGGGK